MVISGPSQQRDLLVDAREELIRLSRIGVRGHPGPCKGGEGHRASVAEVDQTSIITNGPGTTKAAGLVRHRHAGRQEARHAVVELLQEQDLGVDYIERREALIDAVTIEEVRAAAKKLLNSEPAVLVVGPALTEGSKG